MSNTKRPALQRQHTRTTTAKADAELDAGLSIIDQETGERLSVRVRDVKGKHDAALVQAIGLDFMGLLEALDKRQGLDLLAAVVWFAKLVNEREAGTYADVLEEFGYEDVMALEFGKPEADPGPEA